LIGPVVVKARGSRGGRKKELAAAAGVVAAAAVVNELAVGKLEGTSSFGEVRASLPFSKRCPPNVAHLRMVWIKWFCLSGFDKYSSICA